MVEWAAASVAEPVPCCCAGVPERFNSTSRASSRARSVRLAAMRCSVSMSLQDSVHMFDGALSVDKKAK
jgi:hypothetical protein